MEMTQPTWMWLVTLVIALTGAVLGVINTWRSMRRDRVRLRVVPVWESRRIQKANGAMLSLASDVEGSLQDPEGRLGVRVTNLGFVEVTLVSVGFARSGIVARHFAGGLQRDAIAGDFYGEVQLPTRLQSRESITIWASSVGAALDARLKGVNRVYAHTACGLDAFGASALLRRLRAEAGRIR